MERRICGGKSPMLKLYCKDETPEALSAAVETGQIQIVKNRTS